MKGHALQFPVLLFKTGFPLKSTEPSPVCSPSLPLYRKNTKITTCGQMENLKLDVENSPSKSYNYVYLFVNERHSQNSTSTLASGFRSHDSSLGNNKQDQYSKG